MGTDPSRKDPFYTPFVVNLGCRIDHSTIRKRTTNQLVPIIQSVHNTTLVKHHLRMSTLWEVSIREVVYDITMSALDIKGILYIHPGPSLIPSAARGD